MPLKMERPSYWQAGTCCFAKSDWILHAAHEYGITGAFADEYVTDDDDGIAGLNQPVILQHGQCRLDGFVKPRDLASGPA